MVLLSQARVNEFSLRGARILLTAAHFGRYVYSCGIEYKFIDSVFNSSLVFITSLLHSIPQRPIHQTRHCKGLGTLHWPSLVLCKTINFHLHLVVAQVCNSVAQVPMNRSIVLFYGLRTLPYPLLADPLEWLGFHPYLTICLKTK